MTESLSGDVVDPTALAWKDQPPGRMYARTAPSLRRVLWRAFCLDERSHPRWQRTPARPWHPGPDDCPLPPARPTPPRAAAPAVARSHRDRRPLRTTPRSRSRHQDMAPRSRRSRVGPSRGGRTGCDPAFWRPTMDGERRPESACHAARLPGFDRPQARRVMTQRGS